MTLPTGGRYVWASPEPDPARHAELFPGSTGPGSRLVLRGEVVEDQGGPMVRVRHDGWGEDAMVYRDQLAQEPSP